MLQLEPFIPLDNGMPEHSLSQRLTTLQEDTHRSRVHSSTSNGVTGDPHLLGVRCYGNQGSAIVRGNSDPGESSEF